MVTPMLRREFPGVKPWEWEEHPEWLGRAQCALLAEVEGRKIKADAEEE